MKKKFCLACVMLFFSLLALEIPTEAKTDKDVIENGVLIGNMDMSGKTKQEAQSQIEQYVDSLMSAEVELAITEENSITLSAQELGLTWKNPDVVEDAVAIGKDGNILIRYKTLKDLIYENQFFELSFDLDEETIDTVLEEQKEAYNYDAKDATIERQNGKFIVTPGQEGLALDVEASKELIKNTLCNDWNTENNSITLVVEVTEPKVTAEDLSQIKDVLGTYSTSFKSSGTARTANVTNGCNLINGSVVMPGEEYSVYDAVKPFSEKNGYYMAGSYLNGKVVDSIGGGICQVSTTLYNAILGAELDVTMRYNHSMAVSYVEPSFDAAIAESSGKDLKFINNTGYPIYIEGSVKDKVITMTIYGVETRAANRVVTYENVIISETNPETETINQNGELPAGYISISGAHIGYKAQLWKVVTVNGKEESREQVNSSSYAASPRSCVVGMATSNPEDLNNLNMAIATGSIDQVKAVANAIAARDAAAAAAAQQAATADPNAATTSEAADVNP